MCIYKADNLSPRRRTSSPYLPPTESGTASYADFFEINLASGIH